VTSPPGRAAADGAAEPPFRGMSLSHEQGRSLRAAWSGSELFRYVYAPWEPQIESPRPYFHPVRTLGGALVSIYRPHDHVWHKGISWTVANLGPENFWGGPTFVPGQGYQQLANNGAMRHEGFDALALCDDGVRFAERLRWVAQDGRPCLAELRRVAAKVRRAAGAWQLAVETSMTNISGGRLVFGSPTTCGRPDAGYGGLMWRGPRSFTGGKVVAPSGIGGDELMGSRGAWMAFAGRRDGHGAAATLVFCDSAGNFCSPTRWFVRATPFATICPAPFFADEVPLAAGASLTLRYDVFVADGELAVPQCADLAGIAAHGDLLTSDGGG
jgi:Methane oxygenase PmoA